MTLSRFRDDVDALNARPNGQRLTERPECGVVQATGATLLRADDAPGPLPNELELTAGTRRLPVGTNLFQCCTHPWMHAVVTVKP